MKVTKRDMNPAKWRLKFADAPANRLLEGETDTTVRYDDEKDLSEGNCLELVQAETGNVFAFARVLDTTECNAGDVPEVVDALGGAYDASTAGEVVDRLDAYYDADVTPETTVKVVLLELPGMEDLRV